MYKSWNQTQYSQPRTSLQNLCGSLAAKPLFFKQTPVPTDVQATVAIHMRAAHSIFAKVEYRHASHADELGAREALLES